MDLLATMRIYVRVVERGTMSAAARDLDIGQPTVSERIEKLEKFLGVRLLMRGPRALTCTEEGRIFYERSKDLLDGAEDAIASIVRGDVSGIHGVVRLAAPQCLGETVLPPVLLMIRETYPRLNIDLVLNDLVVDPVTEGVDISLRLGRLEDGGYVAHSIGRVRRMLVAASSYLEKFGGIETIEDLARHPFIRVKDTFGGEQLPLLSVDGSLQHGRIQTVMTTSHWRPMFQTIEAAGGIGVVQRPACITALARGQLVELLPQYRIPDFELHALVMGRCVLPLRVRAILDLLKAEIPKLLV